MAARNTPEGNQDTSQRTGGRDQAAQTERSRLANNLPSD
jgi:hypothetical protein